VAMLGVVDAACHGEPTGYLLKTDMRHSLRVGMCAHGVAMRRIHVHRRTPHVPRAARAVAGAGLALHVLT
jgi:hypothetical protein